VALACLERSEKHPRGVQVAQRDGPIINWKCKGFEPTRTGSWVKQPTSSSVLFTRTTPFIWISRRLSSHHGRGNEQHQTFEMMCLRGKLELQQGLSENPYRSKRRRPLYCVDGRKNEVRRCYLDPRQSFKDQPYPTQYIMIHTRISISEKRSGRCDSVRQRG